MTFPQLRYTADRRTLGFVALYFLVATLSWLYFPESWLLRIPVIALNCVLSFVGAVCTHNTIHHPIFRQRWANRVFQVLLSFTYGHSVSAFVPGHNFSHHNHTQTDKDQMRTDKMRFKWNFLNQLLFFFVMAPAILKDEQVFTKWMFKERPNWWRQYALEMVVVMGVKIALLIINWQVTLFVLVIPHFYGAWGIVGTNFWQHDGCDKDHPYNHSRNFKGKLLNYIAFNNGYHGIHHEKPGLHWSLLPEYHEKKIAPHIHPNLDRESLAGYLWETCVWPGKRLDYLGKPVVLGPAYKNRDWMEDVDVAKNKLQLGVEG